MTIENNTKTARVGIGTTTPGYNLDVTGTGRFTGALIASNLSGTNTGDQTLAGVTSLGASTTTRTTFVEVGASRAGSDTVAAGPWFRWTNVAEDRQMLTQLNASNGLTTWSYNGSAWASVMTLTQAGALTISSNLTMSGNRLTISGTEGQVSFLDSAGVWTGTVGFSTNTGTLSFPGRNVEIVAGYNGSITLNNGASGYASGSVNIPYGSLNVSSGNLSVTGTITATSTIGASNFSGTHSGTSSGTNTGDQTNISGNAATATIFNNGSLYISTTNGNTLNSGYNNAGDGSDIWINYRGYNDGLSYFRDFRVGDGKSALVALFTGSNKSLAVTGAISASNLSGTNTGDQTNISGNAATATNVAYSGLTGTVPTWNQNTTGNAATVSNLTAVQFFNNMGNTHSTWTDFNSINNFGFRYVQGSTNGPGTGSSQFYGFSIGLGNEYPYSDYVLQLAIPRYIATDKYLSFRTREATTWGSWAKISAGYADSAGAVAWTNVSSRPTALSGFTNDLGNYGGWAVNSAANVGFAAAFSSYTTDGLFSAQALPFTITTPSGATRIRLGYDDYGGGQYWGRIGFLGTTNWSIGHVGVAGNNFSIGTGYRGALIELTSTTLAFNGQITTNAGGPSIYENRINAGYYSVGDTSDLWINYEGYLNGTSYFRDFRVGNGKQGAAILFIDGSAGTAAFSGAVTAGGDITAYSSDRRLKDNITLIPNALEKVMSIRGVTFDWNDTSFYAGFRPKIKHNDAGVIAQEIQAVLPQAVDYAPFDRDDEGNSKSGENYLTVKYEKIVPLLIEAIKELSQQNRQQQSEIDTLKGQLAQILNATLKR
jgi:hypothetical protein